MPVKISIKFLHQIDSCNNNDLKNETSRRRLGCGHENGYVIGIDTKIEVIAASRMT